MQCSMLYVNLKSNLLRSFEMDHFHQVFRMLRLKDRLEQGRLSHSLPDMRQEEGASPPGESGFQGGFQDGIQGGFQDGFQGAFQDGFQGGFQYGIQGANLRDQGVGYQGSPVQGQELRLTKLSSKALDQHQQRLGHYSTQRYNHFKN